MEKFSEIFVQFYTNVFFFTSLQSRLIVPFVTRHIFAAITEAFIKFFEIFFKKFHACIMSYLLMGINGII